MDHDKIQNAGRVSIRNTMMVIVCLLDNMRSIVIPSYDRPI